MNFVKKFLVTSSMLSALSAFSSNFVGTAQAAGKTLTLSTGVSELFSKEMPQLSVDAPLVGNEISLGIEIEESLLSFVADYSVDEDAGGYFRRIRNLRDVHAEFIIKNADGTITSKTVRIAPDAPQKYVIQLSEFILEASVKMTGTVDVAKCFNANTCVPDGTKKVRVDMDPRKDDVFVEYNFKAFAGCLDIRLEKSTDFPQIQRLVIGPGVARMIRIKNVITAKAQSGLQLFTANLENFGLDGLESFPGIKMDVIPEGNSLMLRLKHRSGSMYNAYRFERCGP